MAIKVRKMRKEGSQMKLRGIFRVQITEGDKVVGDSGWIPNVVTNLGLQNGAAGCLCGVASSKQALYLALGTGGAPATDAVTLAGELASSTRRIAIGSNTAFSSRTTSNGSCTQYLYGTFVSSVLNSSGNISNIGIFADNTAAATLFAGTTYTSSALATNNNVNVTYQLQIG
jgi:hypothetical protein